MTLPRPVINGKAVTVNLLCFVQTNCPHAPRLILEQYSANRELTRRGMRSEADHFGSSAIPPLFARDATRPVLSRHDLSVARSRPIRDGNRAMPGQRINSALYAGQFSGDHCGKRAHLCEALFSTPVAPKVPGTGSETPCIWWCRQGAARGWAPTTNSIEKRAHVLDERELTELCPKGSLHLHRLKHAGQLVSTPIVVHNCPVDCCLA